MRPGCRRGLLALPLVCFTSDIDVRESGRGTLTELDQRGLFAPITKSTTVPSHAVQLPQLIRDAFRKATTGSLGAVHVALPFNVQSGEVDPGDVHADPTFNAYPAYRTAPAPKPVKKAADLLREARRPLLVAGAGVLRSGAWDELLALAHLLAGCNDVGHLSMVVARAACPLSKLSRFRIPPPRILTAILNQLNSSSFVGTFDTSVSAASAEP